MASTVVIGTRNYSGVMTDGGASILLNGRGSFWTNTDIGGGSAMVMNLNNGRTDVYHGPDSKGKGYSIRLKQGWHRIFFLIYLFTKVNADLIR